MKVFIVFSIYISLAWACENLAKLQACNRPEGDCSCQAGLSCVLTKKVIIDGSVTDVKQCMPEDEVIIVETVDFDNKKQASPALVAKRSSGMYTKCSATAECARNFCCPPSIKICLPKIAENRVCNLDERFLCGCEDDLVCKETTPITTMSGITGCENLAEREACNNQMIFLDGDTKLIKQCMPEGAEIDVETININDEEETRLAFRAKRFLFPKRCTSQEDCGPDRCCPVILTSDVYQRSGRTAHAVSVPYISVAVRTD